MEYAEFGENTAEGVADEFTSIIASKDTRRGRRLECFGEDTSTRRRFLITQQTMLNNEA
jgi:hypothetical protein